MTELRDAVTPEQYCYFFDDDAFVKAEVLQPAGFALLERVPVDGCDGRARADLQLVERDRLRFEVRGHLATDYQ